MDIFELANKGSGESPEASAPLADRMRPRDFSEFVGQEKILGEGSLLRRLISQDRLPSMILWGPPGSGKTTLAHIIANQTGHAFHTLSAVTSGKKDVERIISHAKMQIRAQGTRTILFIDEIHRFNKAQQDAFLPHVEDGTIILIGATTENPSFEVISPLLSRCRVFVLESLKEDQLEKILRLALEDEERGLGKLDVNISEGVLPSMVALSDGDARRALNLLEFCCDAAAREGNLVTLEMVRELSQRSHLVYDKQGEEHYNLISALHKSLRGSDPDAALYWLARMLASGEDPMYAARRMIRFASEDIGNADPNALSVAIAARDSYHMLGSPEGELALAQAAVYLATAPKSNSVYAAWNRIEKVIRETGSLPVPMVIRNAPTRLMKDIGYGKDYQYDHDAEEHFAPQEYLPEVIKGRRFYEPGQFGFEKEIKKRMNWWEKLRKKDDKKEEC